MALFGTNRRAVYNSQEHSNVCSPCANVRSGRNFVLDALSLEASA